MFGAHQSLLLAILAENPGREYFLQELGRIVGKKPGVFQIGINSLEKQGLVVSRRQGNLRLFRINEEHHLYKEIKALVRKTVGVEAQLKEAVSGIKGITTAFIYGSYAKDRMRAASDIDVIVVASDETAEEKLVRELARIEPVLGREVNYKCYHVNEFAERRKKKDPFLHSVVSDKYIMLKGTL